MKRRLFAILLALCMVCSLLPSVAFAQEEVTSGKFMGRTKEVTWEFKDGTLYITCEDYAIDDAPWEHLNDRIQAIVFSGKLTLIGSEFQNMPNLTSITWPDGLVAIMDKAFKNCPSLESISIPDGVNQVNSSAFESSTMLCNLKLPNSIKELYGCFHHATCLTQVTLPNKLEHISGAFYNSGLTSIVIPASVKTIGENSFGSCRYLDEICFLGNAPEIASNAFFGVEATVYYPSGNSTWTAAKKLSYGGNLTWVGVADPSKIELKKGIDWNVKNGVLTINGSGEMTDAPWNTLGEYINSVVINGSFTSIADSAFQGFTNINTFTLPDSVTTINYQAFAECTALPTIILPKTLKTLGFGAFYDCTALSELVLPDGLITIGERCFWGCNNLTAITIPASVKTIGDTAFFYCSGMTEITFEGDAPAFKDDMIFQGVTVTAYYPPDNDTWTSDVMQNYGGYVTWMPIHEHTYEAVVTAPTCHDQGYTMHTCTVCNDSYVDTYVDVQDHAYEAYIFDAEKQMHSTVCTRCEEPMSEACTFDDGKIITEATANNLGIRKYTCTVCGGSYEESYVCRLYGDSRYDTSYIVADALKEQLGVEKFENIVVANGMGYADALAGSYLAAVKNAPILLVNQRRMEEVAQYIQANLSENGTVYLLGGETAIPVEMEALLSDFTVKRLAGSNRYATNMEILEEAGTEGQEILICTGRDFPDSLSVSAVGKPILLVNKSLYDYQMEFLANSSCTFIIIGGTGAVSRDIEKELEELGTVTRLGGSGRYETCVKVAKHFFPEGAEYAIVAYSRNFPDGLSGGPLAYAMKAPLLLLQSSRGPEIIQYAKETGIQTGAVLGGPGLIDDATINQVFSQ